jgi:imidazole glycerol phosphate synthase subunit HisF
MAAILVAVVLSRVASLGNAIIAALVVGGIALVGISDLLSAAVAKVSVNGDAVEVRDRLGRQRSFVRADISHATMRSIYAPRRYAYAFDYQVVAIAIMLILTVALAIGALAVCSAVGLLRARFRLRFVGAFVRA